MSYSPNLVPCKGCGFMPNVIDEIDVFERQPVTRVWCPRCVKPHEASFRGGDAWNAAQQPGDHGAPGQIRRVNAEATKLEWVDPPRNDAEAQQQDAHRLAALLREGADIVERMAGRL